MREQSLSTSTQQLPSSRPVSCQGGWRYATVAAAMVGIDMSQKQGNGAPQLNIVLWRRFNAIAQPYFYPAHAGGVGWECLMVALLLGVAGIAFSLASFVLSVMIWLRPEASESSGAVELSRQIGTQPWPVLAALCLGLAGKLAHKSKKQLRGRWARWAMLGLLLFLLLCVTALNVFLSYVFRGIDNKLHNFDQEGFYDTMFGYGIILVFAVPILGLYRYMRLKMARHWRAYLCEFFLSRYLAHQAYYRLDSNSNETQIDNPDQRITEDVDYFTSETLDFILDVLSSVMDLCSFSAVLWTTSKQLMGALLVYAGMGTLLALTIGSYLVSINYEQLRREADLRYSLIRVRENAESIAFYSGERLEGESIRKRLASTLANYDRLITWSTTVTIYQKSFFFLARLVPYLAIGPLFFAKEVDFGTLTQGTFAFSMVLSSVTLIISRIKEISRFTAGINRLGAFYDAIKCGDDYQDYNSQSCDKKNEDDVELSLMQQTAGRIHSQIATGGSLQIKNMSLQTPTGRTLVESLSLAMDVQSANNNTLTRLLIIGPSGVGKSSILRAIAGLWARGSGEISRPPSGEMLFLPQQPYMPLGDLRTQLLYPNIFANISDAALTETLCLLGLADLPNRFVDGYNSVQDWTRMLSVGEQQRIAAARCLISTPSPSYLVLDEATSALPEKDEAILYGLFWKRRLGYISVGHRQSLMQYHDMLLVLRGDGEWHLVRPDQYKT